MLAWNCKQGFGKCGASSSNSSARGGRLGRDYFRTVSLRFIRHGLFLMFAISFFFSSTSSIKRAISPSDMDSSSSESESESESEELQTRRGRSYWGSYWQHKQMPGNVQKVYLPFIFLFLLFIFVIGLVFPPVFFNFSFPSLAVILLFASVLHFFSFFYITVDCPSSFSPWSFIFTFIFIANPAMSLGGRFVSSLTFPVGCILFIVIVLTDFVFLLLFTICTSSCGCLPPDVSPLRNAVYDRKKLCHVYSV